MLLLKIPTNFQLLKNIKSSLKKYCYKMYFTESSIKEYIT